MKIHSKTALKTVLVTYLACQTLCHKLFYMKQMAGRPKEFSVAFGTGCGRAISEVCGLISGLWS